MKLNELNFDEFKDDLDKSKTSIEKKINELKEMIKEEIGEDNKRFYRIGLIVELIEKDLNEMVEGFSDTLSTFDELNTALDKLIELSDSVKEETGLSVDDKTIDPVSRIVKDLNTLDDNDKKRLMFYVAGYTLANNKKN